MSSNVDMANKELLSPALGRISSGVYIATLEQAGEKHGMLATWIIQVAFNPPMLALSVQSHREILPYLSVGSKFAVNALSKNNMDIFKAFAKPFQAGEDRFAGLELSDKCATSPIFAKALSYLDCVVKEHVAAGDHTVILAEVVAGEMLNADEPMLHTRKNGFQY
jgi:flavin reductase (DIM6/NTAB) family NADH-FMN oxidoreductase RutF